MMNNYKVFRYDSHNSGYYIQQDIKLNYARIIAKKISKLEYPKARVENSATGFFEDYENGNRTAWSLINK